MNSGGNNPRYSHTFSIFMDAYAQKLEKVMSDLRVAGFVLRFSRSCHSVVEAAEAVGAQPEDFVKNLCLVAPDGRLFVAILKGEHRLDLKKVEALAGTKLKMATAEQILEKTGFPVGGTPSFGYAAMFFVDARVLEKPFVYSGGGSVQALCKVAPSVLLKANGGSVVRLCK